MIVKYRTQDEAERKLGGVSPPLSSLLVVEEGGGRAHRGIQRSEGGDRKKWEIRDLPE